MNHRGRRGTHTFLRRAAAIALFCVADLLATAATAPASYAAEAQGFYWGTDDDGPTPSSSASVCPSSQYPWHTPNVSNGGECSRYAFYAGNVAGFESITCGQTVGHWTSLAAQHANENATNDTPELGSLPIYYGGGPGADPQYNGTVSEADAWGVRQAKAAVAGAQNHTLWTDVMIYDVEDNGYEGWNERTTSSCTSGGGSMSTSLDRTTFDGFWHYIHDQTYFRIGVYSSPGNWTSIFSTGSDATLHTTTEITADWGGSCRQPAPSGWTQDAGSCSSNTAQWFGGIDKTSDCAFGWQWAPGDYDQIDSNRTYSCA